MASATLKPVNLVLLSVATSDAWQYFGFKTKDGNIINGSEVSL